ncbi:hypothetical protein OG599_16955 [Streptomyces sp. NBC_01335]|uniref:anti-sigma factor family protein n=1 Tax=Streptomyces sp. NBC_01335 TaxID=2903828 RepID=UPI002E0E0B80|nr:hypothetical protein OG599_16955 [Streptomyces sp. NBC_01335]
MTSTTDTTQHPDVTEISDFAEDILPVARATEIRRHLLTCALCEDVHSSLEEIRSLLGSLPEPSPVSADIADRIDAALAAETLLGSRTPSASPSASTDVSRETASQTAERPTTPTAEHIAEHAPGAPAGTPPKPGAPMSRSTAHPSSTSTGPGRGRFPRRRRVVLGTVFGAAILGMGALVFQTAATTTGASSDKAGSGSMAASAPPEGGADAAASSAVEFTTATLADQVRGLLGSASALQRTEGAKGTPQEAGPSGTPTVDRPLQAPSVPACVQRALGRTASALAVETGIYRGTDTYLVVLPHPTDGSLVTAYLVDAGCTAADPSDTGTVLFTHAYPRA